MNKLTLVLSTILIVNIALVGGFVLLRNYTVDIPQTLMDEQEITNWLGTNDYRHSDFISASVKYVEQHTPSFLSTPEFIIAEYTCSSNECLLQTLHVEVITRPSYDHLFNFNSDVYGYYSKTQFLFDFSNNTVMATTQPERKLRLHSPYWSELPISFDEIIEIAKASVQEIATQSEDYVMDITRTFDAWQVSIYKLETISDRQPDIEFQIDFFTGDVTYTITPMHL